jgi:hypothetical protein
MWSTEEHSIECPVNRIFAWRFWTNVDNWRIYDPSIEAVDLDGPFAAGTNGATRTNDGRALKWKIISIEDGSSAVIDAYPMAAILRYIWKYEDTPSGGTRITQQVEIRGTMASVYTATLGKGMAERIPQRLQLLSDALIRAAAQS